MVKVASVREFQKDLSLPATGKLDVKTFYQLENIYGQYSQYTSKLDNPDTYYAAKNEIANRRDRLLAPFKNSTRDLDAILNPPPKITSRSVPGDYNGNGIPDIYERHDQYITKTVYSTSSGSGGHYEEDPGFKTHGTGKDTSIPSNLYDPQNDSKYSISTQNILADLSISWYESNDESSKNAVLTLINITRNDANDHYVKEAIKKFTDELLNGNFGGGLLTEPILQWAGMSESELNEKSDKIFIAQLGLNPFKVKSAQEIDRLFREKGFKAEGTDPANGKGGYVNPKTGRSY